MESISYQPAVIASPKTGDANGTAASVSHTVETDLLVIKDPRYVEHSQLTVYIKQVLSTATKVSYGYYFSFDGGSTWYKVPIKDLSTNKGNLVDVPSYIDANSPVTAVAGTYATLEDLPMSGANAFKVTGLAATNDAGAVVVTAMCRNN